MNPTHFSQKEIEFPEIFIGIVSPVGTDIAPIINELKNNFENKGYIFHHIKLSKYFDKLAEFIKYKKLKKNSEYERIDSAIKFGDFLRERFGEEILAAYAISKIIEERTKSNTTQINGSVESHFDKIKEENKFEKRIYVIDQLKTEKEISLLRKIYGNNFFQISIYSARDIRVENLSSIFAPNENKRDPQNYRDKAEKLVMIDEDEVDNPYGQKVGKIFQFGDVIINVDTATEKFSIERQVKRFIELLFGINNYSPSRSEYGMYLAYAAALRSLDLSRQVGAAIFRESGEIASLGSNEVPKAEGGTYWTEDEFDAREYRRGHDSNHIRKEGLLKEIVDIFKEYSKLTEKERSKIKSSQFMEALEYGRIIHAEMSAITDAARLGIKIKNGTLYCTTFPCHICSKHIVASGIKKVVFLEPYPKSLTHDLHSDSVHIEGRSRGSYQDFPAVVFIPFFGIAPRRYREFFARGSRKEKTSGKFKEYQNTPPKPIISLLFPWYGAIENEILKILNQKLKEDVKLDSNLV